MSIHPRLFAGLALSLFVVLSLYALSLNKTGLLT